MADNLISKTSEVVVSAVEGADDIITALRKAVRGQTVGTLKDVGDIGGTVAGSFCPEAPDIFHESHLL